MSAKLSQLPSEERLAEAIIALARAASIEINVSELQALDRSRSHLAPRTRMYVSHLPKQKWEDTVTACRTIHRAELDPIPHIPVRLIRTAEEFRMLIDRLVAVGVRELLLIAGDYSRAVGPYPCVADVLRAHDLEHVGIERVSFAGHPEGHPVVDAHALRSAECEKSKLAADAGLHVTFLTQFFFESAPFLTWSKALRSIHKRPRLVAGLAGPANPAALFKFAIRCGVGPSMRALGARPLEMLKLMQDHGPEHLITELASADPRAGPDGIHLFCFGGFARTVRWLSAVANAQFDLRQNEFKVLGLDDA